MGSHTSSEMDVSIFVHEGEYIRLQLKNAEATVDIQVVTAVEMFILVLWLTQICVELVFYSMYFGCSSLKSEQLMKYERSGIDTDESNWEGVLHSPLVPIKWNKLQV